MALYASRGFISKLPKSPVPMPSYVASFAPQKVPALTAISPR